MTSPEDWLLSSYAYPLPAEAIAQRPVEPRHSARLLIVEPGEGARHRQVWDWVEELRPGDLMVVNDTRVLHARLRARRSSGGIVEVLVLEPWSLGEGSDWLCLLKPAKRVKLGEVLELEPPKGQDPPPVPLQVVGHHAQSGGRVVRFPPGLVDAPSLEPFLRCYGSIPLPPYIQGSEGVEGDRYQTRYAAQPGAVAAPTAGLHLSDALLQRLQERGVVRATVTLHVGLGTFRPLEQERLEGLELHSEWVEVTPELVAAVEAARLRGGRVVAVGTTSVRSLEGVAALHGGQLQPYRGPVNLVIQPGFRFRVVQGLLTNFHLPRSSLLLLVSALIGRERLLALYGEALEQGYRFFSFGDAMWIPPEAVVEGACAEDCS
ncbi:MAG: tRNA preQ1(34) S-adenosylmethionine ribosyltransferase-isomerase QueA [Cyanobacteriota bacterium]|jgi:S-adenosylmethionine:tRNA ribosyltransferase-isomerase|nr:tRNA preQ1(34) S-adenosylmethionine ribosyltransferase-isomerase QueA [Cyanobacteriota bacterium]